MSAKGKPGVLNVLMLQTVPSFANKFFYSLGFLSALAFIILIATGVVMAFYGPGWWLIEPLGKFTRSIHLWATQAFVLFVIIHLFVVFSTSGFKKPRRITWILGVLMFFFVMAETEFGYVLRGDFSSQWRSLQGADFYNGAGLGRIVDALNYKQIYGIHIAVVPLVVIGLLLLHYSLVRILGIANPVRKGVQAKVVPANHTKLFLRGGALIGLIILLAVIFPSPYLKPSSVREIAQADPTIVSKTLAAEFAGTSDTATYMDNIDPYTYDVRNIYIYAPYHQYLASHPGTTNELQKFQAQSEAAQQSQLKDIQDYYENPDQSTAPKNSAMSVINSLTSMAASGLYEHAIAGTNKEHTQGNDSTYVTRFLADTGVLEERATNLNLTTEQYGMLREESKSQPAGAWWLAPIGLLNHTVLSGDENGDRDAAAIFGLLLLSMLAFPFIPGINQIPEKLRMYKLFQRK